MSPELIIFAIAALIVSVILHEVSHGYVANMLGDPTARLAGRLTLNPISHVDPLGSIILPALLVLSGSGILIGWAKPVPYNPYNLRGKYAEGFVAGAGAAVNLLLAVIFGLLIRAGVMFGFATPVLVEAASVIVYINILLALFNLIPVPPLDGSKVLASFLPGELAYRYQAFIDRVQQWGFLVAVGFLFLFLFLLWPFFAAALGWLFTLLTGLSGLGI